MKINKDTKIIINDEEIEFPETSESDLELNINNNSDKYVFKITSIIIKGTKADKMFKSLYKSKKEIKQFTLPSLSLPLNDYDFLNMYISSRVRGDKVNTYEVSVCVYNDSDTYKYLKGIEL